MSITLVKDADLGQLSTAVQATALAIYLPLEVNATNHDANRIRLKNAIAEVKREAPQRFEHGENVAELLLSLESLGQHELFRSNYAGIGILADIKRPKELEVYPLWRAPELKVSFGEELSLSPIVQSLSRKPISVLCLADNGSRLFRGHQFELADVTSSASLPESLDEVIRFEKAAGLDGNEHFRQKSASGVGSYHGEGPTSRLKGEFERRYFREIGEALEKHLWVGEKLLLACVQEKAALFREVNPDLEIFERALHGNFEKVPTHKIVSEASELLHEIEQENVRSEMREVENLVPEQRLQGQEKLAAAAQEGRIERLFLKDQDDIRQSHESLVMQVLRTGGEVRYVTHDSWEPEAMGVVRW